MAIYGIGAYYAEDVSPRFIESNVVGVGWSSASPELHEFIRALKVGDIVYIKSYAPSAEALTVRAIGIITDSEFVNGERSSGLVEAGRNVSWLSTQQFDILPPTERNNVRRNTLYEEWHPVVQRAVLERVIPELNQSTH